MQFLQEIIHPEKYYGILRNNDGYTLAHIIWAKDKKIMELELRIKELEFEIENQGLENKIKT